ncbi:MAG: DUF2116 family Zn-ribbon domain-containing protein [Clostridia bacterium]|nr:DUF2116 family Zn-ribbon domain-containing protein [Clostridia bacterium]
MNCRKCGKPINEEELFCSECGTAVKKKKGKLNIVKRIILSAMIICLCTIFLFTGIEIGRTHEASLPKAPNFIEIIASTIKNIPGIPFSVELTQEKLNEIISKNEENLKPLSGAKLTITKDKTLILTGNVEKEHIEELVPGEIPSYFSIFLPQTISIYIEVSFPEAQENLFDIIIKNVTIAGITFSEEFTETLGINSLASQIISDLIESEQSPYYQLTKISLEKSKTSDEIVLKVSGTAKLS